MPDQLLINYIDDNLESGVSKEAIVQSLVAAGWQQARIDEAFAYFENRATKLAQTTHHVLDPTNEILRHLFSSIELLKDSWRVYAHRVSTFMGIYAVSVIPSLLLGFMVIGMRELLEQQFQLRNTGVVLIFLPVGLLFIVSALVLLVWSQLAIIHAIRGRSENIGIRQSYKRARSQIVAFIWLSFLGGIIVAGATLLLVIPGFLFAIWFSLAFAVFVSENLHGTNALLKSKAYIQGFTLLVLVRLFILILAILAMYLGINLLFTFIRFPILETLVQWVLPFVLIPYALTYLYELYENLKEVKGAIVFTPTRSEKTRYILAGLTGLVGVPVVLTLLFLVLYPSPTLMKARDSQRMSDLKKLQVPLEQYYSDKKVYPTDIYLLVPTYINTLPKDPKTRNPYEYKVVRDLKSYELCAKAESNADGQICNSSP